MANDKERLKTFQLQDLKKSFTGHPLSGEWHWRQSGYGAEIRRDDKIEAEISGHLGFGLAVGMVSAINNIVPLIEEVIEFRSRDEAALLHEQAAKLIAQAERLEK